MLLSRLGVARRNPGATAAELRSLAAEAVLGPELAAQGIRRVVPEPLRVTLAVARALERLGIPYFVGGSLASSAHGVARATLDADIVARLDPEQARRFVGELGQGFYADVDAIADAARQRSSFNVIHMAASPRSRSTYSCPATRHTTISRWNAVGRR